MTISIIAESALPQSIIAALQSAINGKPPAENQIAGGGEVKITQTEPQKMAVRQNWVDLTLHRWGNTYNLNRLPWLFSPEEVHSVYCLPIADRTGVWGLPSVAGANDARRPEKSSKITEEISIGTLHLSKKQLTQHLLISGVPGSGKTNTSLYLLETLWRSHTSETPTDSFNNLGIHIYYKKPGICEAIEIFEPAEPVFMEINLLQVKFSELKQWFQKIDDEVEIDDTGLTSYKFGISLYAPSASEYPEEAVEAVIVFDNGYYD
ncbi:hypothetical protein B4U84_13415 [Westiellopsis prolifica IICB1]|nr:hypothetical protein B4U84_13415 [Westiellopsis prolifica IICB1]